MGRGARGGGGLRAGPGADAWLRGVRFWRGLARIHSVNRELETVWPDGSQLRLTPTSASAAPENPCRHRFALHLGHSGATAWLPKRDRASAGTRFRHSEPRPNAALTDLDWDARARAECEQKQPKYDQNARSMLPKYYQNTTRNRPEHHQKANGHDKGHRATTAGGGTAFPKKPQKTKKSAAARGF